MMKKRTGLIILLLGLLMTVIFSGCDFISIDMNTSDDDHDTQTPSPSHTEQEMPSSQTPVVTATVNLPDILVPAASGQAVEENGQAVIDFSNAQDGYIMAKYTEATDMKIKLLLTIPEGIQYTYSIQPNGQFDVFPLSGGNGVYEIGVFKQVEGTRYSMVLSATIDVVLTDEFAPFLRPNQYVNFHKNSAAVRKAAELTAGITDFMDKVTAIYHYIITHIDYDTHLAETVQSGYIPDLDEVLARGEGICFDYAALMAAMLRSQRIPTKLVIGYTGDVYHAWISVYSEEDGWLDNVIHFNGRTWELVDPTFAANGSSRSAAQYIGDGANYTAQFFH